MHTGRGQVLGGTSRGLSTASMPADRARVNQGVGKRHSTRFRRLYETLLPENLGKHCRDWPAGKTVSEIKLLIHENCKPLDLILYTDGPVTKDQSWWGFTVKQGATTIYEDSAVYTVSTSSLTMAVVTVTMPSAG